MHSVRHLELVRALAEHRNFGRAAAALRVSQPSLTRSLKTLEDQLGVSLFDRAGVTPTVFGEIVLRRGRELLSGFAEIKREIDLTRGLDVGELSIAVAFFTADISGNLAAARLSARHPNLSIDLRVLDWAQAYAAVLSGEVDVGFVDVRGARDDPNFVAELVRTADLAFFCAPSHPLAKAVSVSLAELSGYPWAGPSLPLPLGAALPRDERPCGAFNVATGRFHPRIRVESFSTAKQIVLAGGALSAGFPLQIAPELAAGELVLLHTEQAFLTLDYGFVTKRGRALSPAVRAYMKLVREVEKSRDSAQGPAAAATLAAHRPRSRADA